MEIRMYKNIDPDFPTAKTLYAHFGSKVELVRRLANWLNDKEEYQDVASMVADELPEIDTKRHKSPNEGYVYLLGWGTNYKIGRSDNLERRIKEISTALPDSANLIHTIRTDDPSGIEAYWHRRFVDKRGNGEWFKLTKGDVAAFKRRKYQ